MDRLKSLRSNYYHHLRKACPESSAHDDWNNNDWEFPFLDNQEVVVSIDDDNSKSCPGSTACRSGIAADCVEEVSLVERRASSLPETKLQPDAVYMKKEELTRHGEEQLVDQPVVQGIRRECSYSFPKNDEIEVAWEKKAQEESRKDRPGGTSFDFEVIPVVDPPSRLIGNFLQSQKEKGENSLDLDFHMDLDAPEAVFGWLPREVVSNSRQLPPLSEPSELIKEVAHDAGHDCLSGPFPPLNSMTHPPAPPAAAVVTAPLPTIKLQEPVRPASNRGDLPQHGANTLGPSVRDEALISSGGLRARSKATSTESEYSSDKVASPTTRESFNFSKNLKSRLAEPPIPCENPPRSGTVGHRARSGQVKSQHQQLKSQQQLRSGLVAGRTGFLGKVSEEEDDPFKDVDLPQKYKSNKWGWIVCLEWIALVLLAGFLVCSTVIPRLQRVRLWTLELWKWVTLVLVTMCGRLVSDFIIRIVVFFIERNFLLRKRVLYFVYALRRGVQNCMWLAFVLLTWHLIFQDHAQRVTRMLVYITRLLQCFLIATVLAVVKTFLIKVLASMFHMGTYFERIRDSLFNQYVVETLSGPPVIEIRNSFNDRQALDAEVAGLRKAGAFAPGLIDPVQSCSPGCRKSADHSNSLRSGTTSHEESKLGDAAVLSIDKLHKMNQRNVSAWNLKRLINVVKHTGVATLTHTFNDSTCSNSDHNESEIKSEHEAKAAAKQVFHNVVKPGRKYIVEDDLLRFLSDNEVARALPLFDGAVETGKISPQALKNYVINVYRERRALALSLSDTKTAVNKLHRIINVVLAMVVIVIWSLILGIATKQLLVFLSSQVLLVVFVFGNTLKTVFEAIVFLFVMHPFDVGDRCVIDGVQYVVEEMNILTTVFLGDYDAKVWFPNSVLATKPIQNFYRSPNMGDSFDFFVHDSTPGEKIAQLRDRVGKYTASKPHHWKGEVSLLVADLAEGNKMKLSLGLSHTMNHQDFGAKMTRKSDLLWEMKRLLEELGIEYHLPPQEVHIRSLDHDQDKLKAF